jgi:hypothetical protein
LMAVTITGIRDQTRNPKPETRSPKPEAQSPPCGVRGGNDADVRDRNVAGQSLPACLLPLSRENLFPRSDHVLGARDVFRSGFRVQGLGLREWGLGFGLGRERCDEDGVAF